MGFHCRLNPLKMCYVCIIIRVVWKQRVAPTEATILVWNDTCTTSGTWLICCHTPCLYRHCLCDTFTLTKLLLSQDECLLYHCLWCIWDSWKCFWFTEHLDPHSLWLKKWYVHFCLKLRHYITTTFCLQWGTISSNQYQSKNKQGCVLFNATCSF